jgi:hypothetical protein
MTYICAVNEKSLLPIFIPAKEMKTFSERFLIRLEEVLQRLDIAQPQIEHELQAMSEMRFCKTNSKVVLGCQNDYIRMASYMLRDDSSTSSLTEYTLELSKTPFKSIAYASSQEMCRVVFNHNKK